MSTSYEDNSATTWRDPHRPTQCQTDAHRRADATPYPVDSAIRPCCGGIGGHAPDCSAVQLDELTDGPPGRWLGRGGIFCHTVPDIEDLDPKDWYNELAQHTMVTAIADWAPSVHGELIRWVDWDADEVTYGARISGLEETAGICDVSASTRNSLAAISKVTSNLVYMWDVVLDPVGRGAWSTWSWSGQK